MANNRGVGSLLLRGLISLMGLGYPTSVAWRSRQLGRWRSQGIGRFESLLVGG